ncbi:MAG: hypothetical protein V1772_06365, partial [Chloroflexota bacterium]
MSDLFGAATTIARLEWAPLPGQRPRAAGCNARLGAHGQSVRLLLARVTASDGVVGWGWSQIGRDQAAALVGRPLAKALGANGAVSEALRAIEY